MAFLNFNAEAVEPQQSFEPIPAGTYHAAITESEIVNTKSGTGQMLKVTWQVIEGPLAGRKVFDRLNIANNNPKAEEIGQRQLSALCHAAGVLKLQDTQQLHGIPVAIKVTIRKDDTGQYSDSNEVKDYRAIPGGKPMASAPGTLTPPAPYAAAPAAAAQAPWAANRAA